MTIYLSIENSRHYSHNFAFWQICTLVPHQDTMSHRRLRVCHCFISRSVGRILHWKEPWLTLGESSHSGCHHSAAAILLPGGEDSLAWWMIRPNQMKTSLTWRIIALLLPRHLSHASVWSLRLPRRLLLSSVVSRWDEEISGRRVGMTKKIHNY